jgi:ligand-binding sensor domain-containing protein
MENGLAIFDRATARWSLSTSGLPSPNVTALAAAGGMVYIGTDNGLVRAAEQNLR